MCLVNRGAEHFPGDQSLLFGERKHVMTAKSRWLLFRDEYVTAVWILALASGVYHLGLGILGVFALSGREGVIDWVLLLTGFCLPMGAAICARRYPVGAGWLLIGACFCLPMLASMILAAANGDIDLPMDVLRRVASPSGIVGLLLLVAARAPERRTLEEPGA
jgi:hypothetical protein